VLKNLPNLDQIEKYKAEKSLSEFIKQAWNVVEPATYVHGWHIDAICQHLEAVSNGTIRNIVINIPPRHAKSLIVCVFWFVWEWINRPYKKFVFTSYSREFSFRDSLKCRRLIESPWFQSKWGNIFKITKDQNTKGRFENDKGGFRFATSVDAGATGEGGDYIIVDDAHSTKEAESDAVRQGTIIWWDETMGSRDNDPKKTARIAIGQRQHYMDLYGHLLKKKNQVHLCLPAEYEGNKNRTIIGFEDPRTYEGELLWPARIGPDEINDIKERMGSYAYTGQYQQRPSQREGAIIKIDWLSNRFSIPRDAFGKVRFNDFRERYQSWDTAFKEGEENDYSVCTSWGLKDDGFYLLHRFKMRCDFPTLEQRAMELAAAFVPNQILIEDKASGQSLVQALKRRTRLPVKAVKIDRDKVARLNAVSGYIEAKRLWLPQNEEWVSDYIDELTTFPACAHDDSVDSTTQFLLEIALRREASLNLIQGSLVGR
jgi:predicted phage terminase large subunit-like protein